MKIWCFEKVVGSLKIPAVAGEWPVAKQCQYILEYQVLLNYFIQEPGMLVKHNGSYAHFVVTYIKSGSRYGLWSVLAGWETYTPDRILAFMGYEGPQAQGAGGYLKTIKEVDFLSTCAFSCKIPKISFENSRDMKTERTDRASSNSTEGKKRKKSKRMNSFANISVANKSKCKSVV